MLFVSAFMLVFVVCMFKATTTGRMLCHATLRERMMVVMHATAKHRMNGEGKECKEVGCCCEQGSVSGNR
jgi:hypothetical protein